MSELGGEITRAIERVIGPADTPVPLHEPELGEANQAMVRDCLASGWVSSVGHYVDHFEELLVDFTAARHAVAVVNGTSALHICARLAGLAGNRHRQT